MKEWRVCRGKPSNLSGSASGHATKNLWNSVKLKPLKLCSA